MMIAEDGKLFIEAEKEIEELKNRQLFNFAVTVSILLGILLPLNLYRNIVSGTIGFTVFHSFNYLLLITSLLPVFKTNIEFRKIAVLPIITLSSIMTFVRGGTYGVGILFIISAIFFVYFYFSFKVTFYYVLFMVLSVFSITFLRMRGILPEIFEEESFRDYSMIVVWVQPVFMVILLLQFYYFFNSSIKRLKASIVVSKVSTEELSEEKRTSAEFLDSAPGLFFLYDENWELIRWNAGHRKMTGYSDDELYRRKALSWFEGEDLEKIRRAMSKVFVDGEADVEAEIIRKDGSKFPISMTGRRVMMDGCQYVCGIGLDISEKRRLEQEVRQAQKMEALGTIAGGIAHDLNNVLAGLMGFSDIIKEDLKENRIPKIDYVDNIISSGERAVGIVRQILMFSRRAESKKLPIRLTSVTRDVLKLIERTIPKSITINQDLDSNGFTVMADINQIHQVIMNLCTNAWHAMRSEGGTLSVSLKNREVRKYELPVGSGALPGIYECIEIKDTGIGIDEAHMEKIFQPFFTTKPEGEGTGLGLAVVKKIVQFHGGFLIVDSVLGKGTTFSVYLPVTNQQQVYSNLDANEDIPGGKETILVVDDEPQLREATVVILDRLGYNVIAAEDGVEGLSRFESHKKEISLVLTDLAMPRMTGFQMSKKIKSIKPHIPIILCTGYSESIDKGEIPNGFFNVFLHKPIRKKKLAGIIRKVLNGEEVSEEENDV